MKDRIREKHFSRWWQANSRPGVRWRTMATRSSSSSPSAPPTFRAQSAWPSSGEYLWVCLSCPYVWLSKQCLFKFKQTTWKFLDGDWSSMEDLHRHDCRVFKRMFQDHWIGRDCLELPINSGTKLQQPGDLKTKKQQIWKFCTFIGLLGPPDNSKKKRSSKLKKFCTFSCFVVSTWSEFDSKL